MQYQIEHAKRYYNCAFLTRDEEEEQWLLGESKFKIKYIAERDTGTRTVPPAPSRASRTGAALKLVPSLTDLVRKPAP